MEYSVASSLILMVAKALDAKGLHGVALRRESQPEPTALKLPHAKYPASRVKHFWNAGVERTGDPAFGLYAAKFWHPMTLRALNLSGRALQG